MLLGLIPFICTLWNENYGGVSNDTVDNEILGFMTNVRNLYRALLFPRRLEEWTPSGWQHWSPYDGKVHAGPGVTDNGFWDTFRTVYPLLALLYPRKLGDLLEGWLNAYRAGGWLPKWASPGYRDSMVGTFADVVFAICFTVEVLLRLVAYGRTFFTMRQYRWNILDMVVVFLQLAEELQHLLDRGNLDGRSDAPRSA